MTVMESLYSDPCVCFFFLSCRHSFFLSFVRSVIVWCCRRCHSFCLCYTSMEDTHCFGSRNGEIIVTTVLLSVLVIVKSTSVLLFEWLKQGSGERARPGKNCAVLQWLLTCEEEVLIVQRSQLTHFNFPFTRVGVTTRRYHSGSLPLSIRLASFNLLSTSVIAPTTTQHVSARW
jgi:hypothetical protein